MYQNGATLVKFQVRDWPDKEHMLLALDEHLSAHDGISLQKEPNCVLRHFLHEGDVFTATVTDPEKVPFTRSAIICFGYTLV